MKRLLGRLRRDERGESDVIALLVIVPLIAGVLMLFVFVGRQGRATQGITHAAAVAARAASAERSSSAAGLAAERVATASLAGDHTACEGGPSVSISADSWEPGGVVTVTVTCHVATGELGAIDAPARQYSATSRAVIDEYRGFSDEFSNSEASGASNSRVGWGG